MSYASEADDIAELEAEDTRLALAEVDQVKAEADRLFARGDAESGGGAKGPPAGHRAYGRAAELYLRALDGVHRGGAGDTELCCSIHLNLAMTAFRVHTYAPMFRHAAEAVRVADGIASRGGGHDKGSPTHYRAYQFLGLSLVRLGRSGEGFAAMETAARLSEDRAFREEIRGFIAQETREAARRGAVAEAAVKKKAKEKKAKKEKQRRLVDARAAEAAEVAEASPSLFSIKGLMPFNLLLSVRDTEVN